MRSNSPMKHYATATLLPVLMILIGGLINGCSSESPGFETVEGKPTPYILKEDCRFTIVEELSKAGVTSPEVSGTASAMVSASISLGSKSITVSDCAVTRNSHSLPIYEG